MPNVPNTLKINRELVVRVFFFTTFAFLLYQLFLLAEPFMTALLLASMLAIGFYPLNVKMKRRMKSPTLVAMIMTVLVVLVIVVPLVIVAWLVFRESHGLLPVVQNIVDSFKEGDVQSLKKYVPPSIESLLQRISNFMDSQGIDTSSAILRHAQGIGAHITALGGLAAKNIFLTLFNALILIFSLFFMFRDGDKWLRWVLSLIPMEEHHKQEVAKRAYETFRAVTIGVFLTAAAQGLVATMGFLIAGTRLPALLGITTTIAAFFGASFLVTLPVAFFTMSTEPGWGIFLLIWGAGVVGLMDNFLKPVLIGSRARMPFILVFFSILGGLKMYGLLGLVLGPLLVAGVLTFIKIYREAYNA